MDTLYEVTRGHLPEPPRDLLCPIYRLHLHFVINIKSIWQIDKKGNDLDQISRIHTQCIRVSLRVGRSVHWNSISCIKDESVNNITFSYILFHVCRVLTNVWHHRKYHFYLEFVDRFPDSAFRIEIFIYASQKKMIVQSISFSIF